MEKKNKKKKKKKKIVVPKDLAKVVSFNSKLSLSELDGETLDFDLLVS